MSEEQSNPSIELAGKRVVSFKDKGKPYTLEFRRLTSQDWMKYFGGISVESERVSKDRVDRFDFKTPGAELVENALTSVTGYKTRDGKNLCEVENWKKAIPYGHRSLAADLLQDAQPNHSDNFVYFDPEAQEVVIDAKWGSLEPGSMVQFNGLIHRFKTVGLEHQRRFNRATSEARVVGGSRQGRTIYPGRHKLLAEMYDELIVSVDGYTFEGTALGENVELIRREMDTFHKVASVTDLFTAPEEVGANG